MIKLLLSEISAEGVRVSLKPDGKIGIDWPPDFPGSRREEYLELIRKNKDSIIEALRGEAAESNEQAQDQEPDDPARRHYMEPAAFLSELRAIGGSLTIKPDGQPWISFADDTPREIKDRLTLVYVNHKDAIIEELKKEPAPAAPEEMRLRESSEYRELRANLLTYWHYYGRTPTIDEAFRRYPKHPRTAVRAAIEDMAAVCPDCARRLEINSCTHRKPEAAWFDFKLNRQELNIWIESALRLLPSTRPPTQEDIEAICKRGEREKGLLPVVIRRAVAQIRKSENGEYGS
ncbi:hypothetical protein [Verrucomicrobium sp. 3C]|uniref:hypothetical protein n=1 Tax=Verrucomicrobium sp. 3C TaxID=1134055 RepID=UPI000476ED3B|nr:hypothetical protein [Verrucomicrobium sp. 3C]